MISPRVSILVGLSALLLVSAPVRSDDEKTAPATRIGQDALGDWTTDAPGVRRKVTINDLPAPYDTPSAQNGARVVKRPDGAWPKAPKGFEVTEYATGLQNPRVIITAPNGDSFIAESGPGRIKLLRDADGDGKPEMTEVFAEKLSQPFGIAFYPPGPEPKYVYVANTDSVVRFPYKNGDTKASGPPEVIVPNIPGGGRLTGGGHWTRDVVFSLDGKRMFVSVGSKSNVNDDENEVRRAISSPSTPREEGEKIYASGIRNPVGLAVQPGDGATLDLGQRARRPRRSPRARLHHARRGRAASTAGPGITSAITRTRGTRASIPN